MLSVDAPLAYNAAQVWLSEEYLYVQMGPPQTMVQHLCTFLSVTEIELCEGVHSQLVRHMQALTKVCEQWFQRTNQDPTECAANVLLSGKPIDGLFVVLAVAWKKTHVAVVHSGGVWSLRLTRSSCLGDLLLLVMDTGLQRAEAIFRYEKVSLLTIAERVGWSTSPPTIRSVV